MKVKTFLGKVLYKSIGSFLPPSASAFGGEMGDFFRGLFSKMIFAECGKNVNINKKARFGSSAKIGNNSSIGKNSFLQGTVIIGENVMMAENVKIFTTNHNISRLDIPMCMQGSQKERAVVIGDDVWIGDSVIICPGCKIGKGAVLGAGAVIRSDVPDYAIMIGNPATILKFRGDIRET